MTSLQQKDRQLQTCVVRWRIQGAIDGSSRAPPFSIDPKAPDFAPYDDENVRVPQLVVGNLGLIDVSFANLLGGIGDRFVNFIFINSPTAGAADSRIAVVNQAPVGPPTLLETFEDVDLVGTGRFLRTECVFVPQGALLQIRNFPAGGGFRELTLGVSSATSALEEAQLISRCCCLSAG